MASKLSLFLAELKRRKVCRVAAVPVPTGVAILFVPPHLFSVLDPLNSTARLVIGLLPVVLATASGQEGLTVVKPRTNLEVYRVHLDG
ncbi:hypothetical protein ACFL3S_09880 [Gemmatimonadota bacterium]